MSNSDSDFYHPTDEIKLLLKIRGQNQTTLSKATGISLHILNKFINHKTFKGKNGENYYYKVPHIKKAVEQYLNIPGDVLWTLPGREALRKIIADEMIKAHGFKKQPEIKRREGQWKVKTFLKNLVSLGKHHFFGGAR
ncbi:MAG: hypothetical protein ACYC7J_18525 [Syntrophales bacterium]